MGGAKNCPETPRQKMIGMMYLVLTAMLALNVSTWSKKLSGNPETKNDWYDVLGAHRHVGVERKYRYPQWFYIGG